ncbi:MAG: hypothetical protein LBC53_06200 [Spirochaetaceae bacterium]|nr:hypothetical protein [Spirochaetaceae bacterium]
MEKTISLFYNSSLKINRAFFAAAILTLFLPLFSCNSEDGVNKILCANAQSPVFISYKVISGKQVDFNFSIPVSIMDIKLEPETAIKNWQNGDTISLVFEDDHSAGEQITVDMLVQDADGNTLNLLLPFRTRNDRIPRMVINEIRTESGSSGSNKKGEFVEIKTINAGNLGAVRLFISRAGIDQPVYEFPPVEAAANEYIILHVRTYNEDAAVDELGGPESFAATKTTANASASARDLWTHVNSEVLRATDAVYLLNQDDEVIDAVMFYKTPEEWAKNKVLTQTAEMLAKQSAWLGKNGELIKTPSENDAAANVKPTATRTLCRDETVKDSNTANDWYLTDTSNATPGAPNSEKRLPGV